MQTDRYIYLYRRYLLGQCTKEEFQEIKHCFLSAHDADSLDSVDHILSSTQTDISLPETSSERILREIMEKNRRSNVLRRINYTKYSIAACLLMAAFVALYYRHSHSGYQDVPIEYVNGKSDKKWVVLADGSSVYLKRGTKITVPADFNTDSVRNISLQGEAFFAIAPDKRRPFIVKSEHGAQVKVLGTRFNARFVDRHLSVVLTKGAVEVENDQQRLHLKPEEMATYNPETRQLLQQTVDTSFYNAWITSQLYFKEISLKTVIAKLNGIYPDAELKINSKYDQLQFTGYLPTDNLNNALNILEKTFDNYHLTIIK